MALDFSKSKNNALSKAIRKTEDANAKIVKNLPVAALEETQDNEYIFGIEESSVKRLAEEIDESGFDGSIMVKDLHNGHYQVVSGHQRLRAMKELGKTSIPCIVEDIATEADLYRKLLSSNILQRKMTPLAYARAIEAYDQKVLTREEVVRLTANHPELKNERRRVIAHFFNISTGQVYRYQAISKMPAEIQEMCKEADFPYTALESAASFDDEQKQKLLDSINEYNKVKREDETLSKNVLLAMIENIKKAKVREEVSDRVEAPSAYTPALEREEEQAPVASSNTVAEDNTAAPYTAPPADTQYYFEAEEKSDDTAALDDWTDNGPDEEEPPVSHDDAHAGAASARVQAAASSVLSSVKELASVTTGNQDRAVIESLKDQIDQIFASLLGN